ncbi:hypothetical protein EYR38_009907 [Pleurotus pulmonarius]|nr:hypothetical protein EYR38_009907 [Pleurotus pulmonarius]
MDDFYDKAKAVQTLDKLIAERTAAAASPQMHNLDSETTEIFGLSICRADGDAASRLTQRNEETTETEEATIAIQGIICSIGLPPFDARSNRPDDIKRLTHARQSVTLTGLGSTSFDRTVENGRRAYSMFSRYTPNAKLLPRPEFLGRHSAEPGGGGNQHTTIVASNRFFTPIKQAGGLEVVEIDTETDPRGLLAKVDRTRYAHTEDNVVHYYVLTDGDDNNRYTPTTPVIFQIGDIVEIQTSMMCIPQKGNFTVKLVLRSIILLDGSLTMEATNARTLITPTPAQPPKRLKRRNPYAGSQPPLQKTQRRQDHARIDVETDEGGGSRIEEAAGGQQAHLHDEVASEDQAVVTDTCMEA